MKRSVSDLIKVSVSPFIGHILSVLLAISYCSPCKSVRCCVNVGRSGGKGESSSVPKLLPNVEVLFFVKVPSFEAREAHRY